MKKLTLTLIAGMITTFTFAQKLKENQVPNPVKKAFKKQYPTTKGMKWEKEKSNYEVEFEIKEIDYSVLMDSSGNILETEKEITIDALPTATKEYVSKNYAGQKIKEAAEITDAKKIVTYEVEINGKDLIFDSKGNYIKTVED